MKNQNAIDRDKSEGEFLTTENFRVRELTNSIKFKNEPEVLRGFIQPGYYYIDNDEQIIDVGI